MPNNHTILNLLFFQLSVLIFSIFQSCSPIEENKDSPIVLVKDDEKILIDRKGTMLTKLPYEKVNHFTDGLIVVGNKDEEGDFVYGAIDEKGTIVIDISYPVLENFKGGYAVFGMGKERSPSIDSTSEGISLREKAAEMGIIDNKGKIAVIPQYNFLKNLGNGLFAFRSSNKLAYSMQRGIELPRYGMINTNGDTIVPETFQEMYDFNEKGIGIAEVKYFNFNEQEVNKFFYIDQNGNRLNNNFYDELSYFSEDGLGGFKKNGKWGFLNQNGEEIINPIFEDIHPFSEGLAAVKVVDKWGYLDTQGNFAINPKYEKCESFVNGLAPVKKEKSDEGYVYIGKDGKSKFETTFFAASQFYNGYASVIEMKDTNFVVTDWLGRNKMKNNKITLIDTYGKKFYEHPKTD